MDRLPPSKAAGGGGVAAKLDRLRAQRQQSQAAGGKPPLGAANGARGREAQGRAAAGVEQERGQGECSLRTALVEKDEVIKSLRSRLSIAQQQAQQQVAIIVEPPAPAVRRASGDAAVGTLEAQNAQLEGANMQLRQRLQETLLELQTAHDQLHILQQLQQQLEEDVPGAPALVDAALAQERALQNARNERVLQLLKSKDEVIQSFEARFAEAQSEAVSYKRQVESALQQLDTSQVRVCELVEARSKLRQQLEAQEAKSAQEQSNSKAEIAQLQEEVAALRQRDGERCLLHERIITQQADLAAAAGEVEKLSEAVEAANVVIQELQSVVSEREEQLSQRDGEVQQLQAHVARMLGVPAPEARALTAAAVPHQQPAPGEWAQRVAELEAANERLEQALVQTNNRGGAASPGPPAGGCDTEDGDAVAALTIQLAEREGQLQAARQQVEELEALQHLARETALQTEAKLLDALQHAAAAQQQCDELQQRLELSDGVAVALNARVSELVLAEQESRGELQAAQEALARLEQSASEAEQRHAEESQAIIATHAHEVEHLRTELANTSAQLANCQAEAETLRGRAESLERQLVAAQRQQPSRLGRDSGLGRASFARSMLAASEGAAAASVAAVAGAETEEALPVVSWQEAAAMPHDKLLQLLRALQLDVKALQTELEGARAEAAAAQQRALDSERKVHTSTQQQAASVLESVSASLTQMRQSARSAVVHEGHVQAAELRQQHAEEMLRAAQAEVARLKVELASRCKTLQQQLDAVGAQCQRAMAEREAAQQAHRATEQVAAERQAQLAVLMETLEVLHSGDASAQQEHIVSMAAELAAARAGEVAAQHRCSGLERELEAAREQVATTQQKLAAAAASCKAAEQAHAEEAAAAAALREQAAELQSKVLGQQEQVAKVSAELAEARQAATSSRAAASGLQAALRQAQERHQEQLSRERAEAAASARAAHLLRLQSGLQRPRSPELQAAALMAPLQEELAQLRAAAAGQEGLAAITVDAVAKHVQELLVRAQHAETERVVLEAELQSTREQCRAAEAALEERTSEWQVALAAREALQQQAAQGEAVSAEHASQQQRVQVQRNMALSEQLVSCKVQLAQAEAAMQQMAAERDKLGVEASELLSSLTTAEACLPSMPATMAAAGHNSSSGGEGLPGSGTVEQALGSASMPPQQGASGDIEQAARLKSVFQDLRTRLSNLSASVQAPAPPPGAQQQHIAELERHLHQHVQQLTALREQLQQKEGAALVSGSEAQQLQAAMVLLQGQLEDAQRRLRSAEQRSREEVAGSSLEECEALARQAAVVQEQAEQAAREARQQALQEVQAAQCRVGELEAQLLAEQQEKDGLHSAVAQLEAQLAETCATLDAKVAALSLVQGRPAPLGSPAGGSPRRKQPGGTTVAALSQHLLEANLQHVEANLQLRVAEKLNRSLKNQLSHAEQRAAQLKEALARKAADHRALLQQLQVLVVQQGGAAATSAEPSSAGLPRLFSEASGASAAGAQASQRASPAAAEALPPPPGPDIPALQLELARREAEVERLEVALGKALDAQRGQAECFASLTAQAQHKEEELHGRLAALEQASSELAQLRGKCYAAMHQLRQVRRGGAPGSSEAAADAAATVTEEEALEPGHLPELCRELAAQFQEQRRVIEKMQQRASAAAEGGPCASCWRLQPEEPLPPLECSQRAVIRSLTAQLAALQRQLAALAAERDQCQERLRVLRVSLGSGHASEAAIDGLHDAAEGDSPDAWFLQGPDPAAAAAALPATDPEDARLDHAAGMFALLRHHLKALQRAQEQLAALQEQQHTGAGGDGPGGAPPLLHIAHAAAMLAAELPALQATVQVLQVEVASLLRSQTSVEAGPARPPAAPAAAQEPLRLSLPPPQDTAGAELAGPGADGQAEPEGKLLRARQRKDRLKKRCLEAEEQLQAARGAAGAAEAAVQERVAALELAQEQLAEQQEAAAAQLHAAQAAAAQAEAEKEQLQRSLEACTRELADAATLAETLHQQLQAQKQEGLAEAGALKQQLHEAQSVLEQERQEHAQLAASLQAMVAGLQSSGDAEATLRSQLIQLAEKVAVLTASQEAAKLEVEQKESALVALQLELDRAQTAAAAAGAETQRAEQALAAVRRESADLWQLLDEAEHRLHEVESTAAARCQALEARLSDCQPDPPGVASLAAELGGLLGVAQDLQDRCERMEAQAAVLIQQKHAAAVGQWARLARSQRYRTAVKQLRDGLQHDLLEAQSLCARQAAQLEQLQQLAAGSQAECEELVRRLEEAEALHSREVEHLAECHAHEAAALQQEWAAARLELQRQADLMAKAAGAAVEQRAKAELAARVAQVEERALQDITNAEAQCGQLTAELSAVRTEFKRYQALKAVEIKLLEQRVLHLMRAGGGAAAAGGSGGTSPPGRGGAAQQRQQPAATAALPAAGTELTAEGPAAAGGSGALLAPGAAITSVSEIQAVCSSDGIAAALREANLERLQREQVEQQAAATREAAEQLRGRLKAAESELATLRSRLGGEAKAARERAERLQAELQDCQQALRLAKAESGRRLKELQLLQRQAAADEGAGTVAALQAEQQARQAAEAQLREARQGLARKATMVKELRAKVSELEQQLVLNSPAPLQLELEGCQARLKQVQASLGAREATIRELRHRLEEHVKLATEQGAQEERQRSLEVARGLKADLSKREAQVASLRQELQQVHEDLAAATSSMRSAVDERQTALKDTGAQLVRSLQHRQRLSQLAHELLGLVGALSGAVMSGAEACAAHAAASAAAAAGAGQGHGPPGAVGLAQQLSSLVDLPAEDIEALLEEPRQAQRSASSRSGAGTSGQGSDIAALVQEAGRLVEQLHAGFDAGSPGDAALLSSLGTLLAMVKQQCSRACESLETATCSLGHQLVGAPVGSPRLQQHSASGPAADDGARAAASAISHLEEQLRRAAREVAEIEERLL